MKTRTFFKTKLAIVMMIAVGYWTGCGSNGNISDYQTRLEKYLKKDMPVVTASSSKYAAYFDFSGVFIAYDDSATHQTFNSLTQKITGEASSFDIYSLANAKIEMLSGANSPAALFQKLHDSNEQGQLWAPIEKTLKKIADEGRPALLVTDFEEYTKEGVIYRQAYATPYFENWLKRGGDIQFYVTDYMEGSLRKHLYYVVFDYNSHKLSKMVADALQGAPKNYSTFTLSVNSYPMATSYLSANQGGTYHDENGLDVVSLSAEDGKDGSFFMMDSLRAESYSFDASWQDILNNAHQQTLANGAKVPFRHLFSNLFIDLSHADSYNIKQMAVVVTDVEKDFTLFNDWNTAMLNKPVKKHDTDGVYLDWDGHEAGQPYYDDNGNILPEYNYPKLAQTYKPRVVNDMLVFNNDLFAQTKAKDPRRAELAIDFDPRFNGAIVGQSEEQANDLLRIDIVVADADICPQDKINSLFAWDGNDCLSSAIKNVLQDMKPIGSPIYSYFVRIR